MSFYNNILSCEDRAEVLSRKLLEKIHKEGVYMKKHHLNTVIELDAPTYKYYPSLHCYIDNMCHNNILGFEEDVCEKYINKIKDMLLYGFKFYFYSHESKHCHTFKLK